MPGILQVGTMGVLGLAFGFLFEMPHLPAGGVQWAAVLGLAIVCSGFGFTLQPVTAAKATMTAAIAAPGAPTGAATAATARKK